LTFFNSYSSDREIRKISPLQIISSKIKYTSSILYTVARTYVDCA